MSPAVSNKPSDTRPLKKYWESFLCMLFPHNCAVCGKLLNEEDMFFFCTGCFSADPVTPPFCSICNKPVKGDPGLLETHPDFFSGIVCPDCEKVKKHFSSVISAFIYRGTIRQAIHIWKYAPNRKMGTYLLPPFWESVKKRLPASGFDLITPVPIHGSKLAERGFNQAEMLASYLSVETGIPFEKGLLRKTGERAPSFRMNRKERIESIKGTFEAARPEKLNGRGVILVDDVYTTGSTANEASRILKKAGAARIQVVTLARSV